MVLHLLVYLIRVCDQLGEALVFCACIYIHISWCFVHVSTYILTNAYCYIILVL